MLTSGAQAATGHKERWHEIVDWFRKRLFAGDLMAYYLDRNGKLVQVTKDTFALKDAEHMFSEHQQDVLPFLLVEAELDKALNLSALSSKKAANATVREAKMPPKRISQDELRAWFLDRVKKWPNMTPPPNKLDCYQQHRKHFKERALDSRDFIALRQAGGKACIIPRCWRTRGQRPLDWRSKLDDEWVKKLKFKTEHKMPKI